MHGLILRDHTFTQGWPCSQCTFVNEESRKVCELCGAPYKPYDPKEEEQKQRFAAWPHFHCVPIVTSRLFPCLCLGVCSPVLTRALIYVVVPWGVLAFVDVCWSMSRCAAL